MGHNHEEVRACWACSSGKFVGELNVIVVVLMLEAAVVHIVVVLQNVEVVQTAEPGVHTAEEVQTAEV